jgi:hypothetical protein
MSSIFCMTRLVLSYGGLAMVVAVGVFGLGLIAPSPRAGGAANTVVGYRSTGHHGRWSFRSSLVSADRGVPVDDAA